MRLQRYVEAERNAKEFLHFRGATVSWGAGSFCNRPIISCLSFSTDLFGVSETGATISGLTDALDGWLARKLRCESAFGAKLDSVADLLFYAVMIFRILPILVSIFPISKLSG